MKGCVAFSRDSTAEFARFAEQHVLKPVIAKEFAFQDAIEELKELKEKTEVGEIVVRISEV